MILSEPSDLDAELDRNPDLPINPAAVLADLRAAVAAGDLRLARELQQTLMDDMNRHIEKVAHQEAVHEAIVERVEIPDRSLH